LIFTARAITRFDDPDFIGRSPTCETPDTIGRRAEISIPHHAETQPDPRVKGRLCAEMWSSRRCEMRFSCPFQASRGSEESRSKNHTRARMSHDLEAIM
jgi:hypothetical protein